MSFISSFVNAVAASNEKRARLIALQQLRSMSARQLKDLGFDSSLLEKGVKGWPWRAAEPEDALVNCDSENTHLLDGLPGQLAVASMEVVPSSTGKTARRARASDVVEAA